MESPLEFDSTVQYIELIRLLKPSVQWKEASYKLTPPEDLPLNVHEFLKASLGLADEHAKLAWAKLRVTAWDKDLTSDQETAARTKYIEHFLRHGLTNDIGVFSLEPPTRTCVDTACVQGLQSDPSFKRDRELVEPYTVKVTIFTKGFGSIPGFATSRYCRHCHTRYHPTFYVHSNASTRTYYPESLQFLQISTHFYIDVELCELFSVMMSTSWTSATNCARTYNEGLCNQAIAPLLPTTWPVSFDMDVENVWDAFFLHNLILDRRAHSRVLQLLHNAPSQSERLRPALRERNERMVGPGQDAWNHVCDTCCWFTIDENG
ncbi:hypothetical protein GGX14DRAFT_673105, partial [Mycena pura]